jgi:hypothetical protein
MRHPDFRVGGKIFATIDFPDHAWGMVKLTPEQQAEFIKAAPEAFFPVAGKWGLKGGTNVRLSQVDKATLLMAAASDIYFETDHYPGWPAILVRLAKISDAELKQCLERAWRLQAPATLVHRFEGTTGVKSKPPKRSRR